MDAFVARGAAYANEKDLERAARVRELGGELWTCMFIMMRSTRCCMHACCMALCLVLSLQVRTCMRMCTHAACDMEMHVYMHAPAHTTACMHQHMLHVCMFRHTMHACTPCGLLVAGLPACSGSSAG